MVSLTAKYALRILGHLAGRPGQWAPSRAIAGGLGIPANYLGKILNQLGKASYVVSRKGWGGGFSINPEAMKRPISGVVELFDGRQDHQGCIFELRECDPTNPCPLHPSWQRIRDEFQRMLSSVTVAALEGELPRGTFVQSQQIKASMRILKGEETTHAHHH